MADTVQIMGLKQLADNLKKIGKLAEGNAAIAMASAGASVFKKAAKKDVPEKTGKLKENIIIKQISKGPHVLYVTTIRPAKKGKAGKKGTGVRYAHLVEFGTKAHPEPKKGKKLKGPMFIDNSGKLYWNVIHPGAKPRPFMRPAFENNHSEALTKMTKVYNKILEKWQTGYAAVGSLYGEED
jgi:HK97 gp10 family phage protein